VLATASRTRGLSCRASLSTTIPGDDPGIIGAHVGEIDVERDQRAPLVLAEAIKPRIVAAAEPLLADADRVVAGTVQQIAGLARQVLVDLEPHATPRWTISTMRSRASSAA